MPNAKKTRSGDKNEISLNFLNINYKHDKMHLTDLILFCIQFIFALEKSFEILLYSDL